ncbi:hypothetical protein AAFP30_06080 [Gordonia sp. CPCC 205515]
MPTVDSADRYDREPSCLRSGSTLQKSHWFITNTIRICAALG